MPASCSAIPSLAVSGVADGLDERPAGAAAMFVERSSLRGRCRELFGRDGDEGGSFLTTILGALPEPRELEEVRGIQSEKNGRFVATYDLGERRPSEGVFWALCSLGETPPCAPDVFDI